MAKNYTHRSKFPALFTYCLVVLILLAGLLLPLGTTYLKDSITNFEFSKEFFDAFLKQMPVMQLTGAVQNVLASFSVDLKIPFGEPLSALYTAHVSILGKVIDVGAILLILYTLVTLLSVAMLIPVLVSKRQRSTAFKCAVTVELLALAVLALMMGLELLKHTGYSENWNLGILLPFALILAILILQSLIYFGGSGVIKTVVMLISAVAVLLSIFSIAGLIPKLAEPLVKLVDKISFSKPFETSLGLYNFSGVSFDGSTLILLFVDDVKSLFVSGEWLLSLANYSALVLALLVCLNFYLDICGLCKRTTMSMLVCNVLRYLAEILLVAVVAVAVFMAEGSFGLLIYVLLALACVQLVISAARLIYAIVAASKAKKQRIKDALASAVDTEPEHVLTGHDGSQLPEPATTETAGHAPEAVVEEAPAAEEHAPVEEAAVAQAAPVEEKPEVEASYQTHEIYTGPVDKFIRKLTNDEKIEFSQIFLERTKGNLSGIPEYDVGGDNTRFFSSVFIYFARVRDVVSDGLMNKLYEEVHLMN